MKNRLLQTPEGVRDLYRDQCEQKMALEQTLVKEMKMCGYRMIDTPSFEFFDVFNQEFGTTSSRKLYKFFDREGNTLVLRPDITPSIARCAATYFQEEVVPLRFCYNGKTFINNIRYQGRLMERTQSGAELIGDGSVDADAEMIALAVRLLLSSGLENIQISIGHADFLKGLFEASGLDDESKDAVRELILNRNFYGVEDYIDDLDLDPDLSWLYGQLKNALMEKEDLSEIRKRVSRFPRIAASLERLEELDALLAIYGVDRYVSYELALTSEINYYTGVLFAGYTYGSGEAVVAGGRYDTLLQYFGKDAPAIGFAIITDQLYDALKHQHIRVSGENKAKWILYSEKKREEALKDAMVLREEKEEVVLMRIDAEADIEKYETYAANNGITDLIYYI